MPTKSAANENIVFLLSPKVISELLSQGKLETIAVESKNQEYNFTVDDLRNIMAALQSVIAPPQLSALSKSATLAEDYEERLKGATKYYELLAAIVPNFDEKTTNFFIQTYFEALVTVSFYHQPSLSLDQLVSPNKVDMQTFSFLNSKVAELFKQYTADPEKAKSDKFLTVCNQLIDNFLLPSNFLLSPKPKQLAKELITWLSLMQRAKDEEPSRRGGTASKIAALCFKLGTVADSNITDEDGNNVLHLLMQSKLPTEDAENLTKLFLERGVTCHSTNKANKSALMYAAELSFGPNVINIMFQSQKIPVGELRKMLSSAKKGSIYSHYVMNLVSALNSTKSLANIEIIDLIDWIITNSAAKNSSHPSYHCRKHLHELVNHLLSYQRWSNFALMQGSTSLWAGLSPQENAEQIAALDSIAETLEAFVQEPSLKVQLPELLVDLATILFRDKDKCKSGSQPVQLLQFILAHPEYSAQVYEVLQPVAVDTDTLQLQVNVLNSVNRSVDTESSPLLQAATRLKAPFIQMVLALHSSVSARRSDTINIKAELEICAESLAKTEDINNIKFFDGMETWVSGDLASVLFTNTWHRFGESPNLGCQTALLQLLIKFNAAHPNNDALQNKVIENFLTMKVMDLVDALPTATQYELWEVRSLLEWLEDNTHSTIVNEIRDIVGFAFEGNLAHSFQKAIKENHGKNKFIMQHLGLDEKPDLDDTLTIISADALIAVPRLSSHSSDVTSASESLSSTDGNDSIAELKRPQSPKSPFLGFLFKGAQVAKDGWQKLVDKTDNPVLAKLLTGRDNNDSANNGNSNNMRP